MTPPGLNPTTFGYPSHRSGFRSDDTESDLADPVDSPGGYSPPAWRRLGNGSRDSGFWRRSEDRLLGGRFPMAAAMESRESSPEADDVGMGEDVLRRAMRTRLPTGSMSPDKRRSRSPGPAVKDGDTTVKLEDVPWGSKTEAPEESENCECALDRRALQQLTLSLPRYTLSAARRRTAKNRTTRGRHTVSENAVAGCHEILVLHHPLRASRTIFDILPAQPLAAQSS